MHHGLFLGKCRVDFMYYLPQALQPGMRLKAEFQLAFAGGSATNAAIAFTAFGNPASLVTALGKHPLAEVARADIQSHRITLIDLDSLPDRPPAMGSAFVDLSTHQYSVAYAETHARKLRPFKQTKAMFQDVEIVMLDGAYPEQAIYAARNARQQGIPVVLDAAVWKDGLEKLLPYVTHIIASQAFRLAGCANYREMFAALRQKYGILHTAICRGGKSILVDNLGRHEEIPVQAVQVIDCMNAGNILRGAFCHYFFNNDFTEALRLASETASLACASLGPRAWMEQLSGEVGKESFS